MNRKLQVSIVWMNRPVKPFSCFAFFLSVAVIFSCGQGADQPALEENDASPKAKTAAYRPLEKTDLAYEWEHLSSVNGDLPVPNQGNQQTATIVMDVDRNGVNDFIITERTKAPSVVWYQRIDAGWERFVIEKEALTIEAGSTYTDIDGDGDIDIVFGGDGQSNQVWWWENPYPNYNKDKAWTRRLIKDSGANKHHDQIFGDFDGDGKD